MLDGPDLLIIIIIIMCNYPSLHLHEGLLKTNFNLSQCLKITG